MIYISKKVRESTSPQKESRFNNNSTFCTLHSVHKGGFTLLEVLAASVIVTIVSYLIFTQVISLQQKIERHIKLPQQTYVVNAALSDATPLDENFKKGKTYSYESRSYNWQIRREVIKIYQDEEKEYFLDQYVLSIDILEESGEENKRDIFLLKMIEEEKDIGKQSK